MVSKSSVGQPLASVAAGVVLNALVNCRACFIMSTNVFDSDQSNRPLTSAPSGTDGATRTFWNESEVAPAAAKPASAVRPNGTVAVPTSAHESSAPVGEA